MACSPLATRRNAPTRDRLLALARELARRADWDTWETWPTWARLMHRSGWARSTMAGWVFELRLHGFLILLDPGTTPETTPMALRVPGQGNTAAVYGLRVPVTADSGASTDEVTTVVEDKTWTPTVSFSPEKETFMGGSTRAKQNFHSPTYPHPLQDKNEALRARIDAKNVMDFGDRVPVSAGQMLAAAAQLQRQHPVCGRLTAKAIRAQCRAFWAAGWHNQAILHALRYRPASTSTLPTMPVERIVAPARWIAARLGAWRDRRGRVLVFAEHNPATIRARVQARHGRAALAALPAGATRLSGSDLRRHAAQQRLAAERTLARNQRADRLAGLSAPRDRADVASDQRRAQLVAQARSALRGTAGAHTSRGRGKQHSDPPRHIDAAGSVHKRALARARAERSTARRRGRR